LIEGFSTAKSTSIPLVRGIELGNYLGERLVVIPTE